MDTDNTHRKFGSANALQSSASSIRLLAPGDLPAKGIQYHMNHLRRLWQRGDFPAPIKLSPRKNVWAEEAIDAWINSKSEAE